MTTDELKDALQNLFRLEVKTETKTSIEFSVRGNYSAKISIKELKQIVDRLNSLDKYGETEIYNKLCYEVAVGFDSFRPTFFAMRDTDAIEKEDKTTGVKYILSKPSDEYLIYIIEFLYETDSPDRRNRNPYFFPYRIERLFEKRKTPKLLEIIKELIPRFYTLRITSTNNLKRTDFENLSFAFLFSFSYNLDTSISPLRFLEEVSRSIRIRRIRRASIEEIEPPKRTYINDLILHYQKGISSESIDHQFLSFYHIIEHFFEKIYNEEIVNEIKSHLTLPSFSYKREKDIKGLVGVIQKRLKYKNDEFQINEPEALELTLKKFVVIEELKNELTQFDNTLVEYYKQHEVTFSGGNRVNFDSNNFEEIYKNLSNRIYKTRNSIVHSKETDKTRFIPFRDDKNLLREIHLIRVIGEKIIINSSTVNA
jgi:hypothetical protein